MAIIAPNPRFIAPWVNGQPVALGFLETYDANTTTPKPTYKDQAGSVPNDVSIQLDPNGVSPYNVFIDGAYKFVLKNALGVPIYTVDNIVGYDMLDWTGLTATITELNATDTSCILITEDYAVQLEDRGKTLLVQAAGGPVNINLLAASVALNGFCIVIKKIDSSANAVLINAAGGETIDDDSTRTLSTQWDSEKLISNGGGYYIIATDVDVVTPPFSTGDIKSTFKTTADSGWVMLNDGTIGNTGSNATTRANEDAKDLFDFLYATFTNDICPLYDSTGVLSARTTAAADWAALKALRLVQCVGRTFVLAGQPLISLTFTADPSNDIVTTPSSRQLDFYTGTKVRLTTTGTLPAPLVAATDYYVIKVDFTTGQIKLASSAENATLGTAIDITNAGTGIHTLSFQFVPYSSGVTTGEQGHVQTTDELNNHFHPIAFTIGGSGATTAEGLEYFTDGHAATLPHDTDAVGSSLAFNIMQPTVFGNAMIKL